MKIAPIKNKNIACKTQEGAALPIVLLIIAILAIIATTSFRTVSQSTIYLADLQSTVSNELALLSAEQESLFAFLTGQPTQRGLYLGEPIAADQLTLGQIDLSALENDQFWAGNRETRRSDFTGRDVAITYQDGGGLLALHAASQESVSLFLQTIGISKSDSITMAAKLADYQDGDFIRRFQGGERSDYRLLNLPPPSDAPLRAAEEIADVLGFDPVIKGPVWRKFLRNTTFGEVETTLSRPFAPQIMTPVMDGIGEANTLLSNIIENSTQSNKARFTLTINQQGSILQRVVDIDRTPNAPDIPFHRYWVSDTRLSKENGLNIAHVSGEQIHEIPELFKTKIMSSQE